MTDTAALRIARLATVAWGGVLLAIAIAARHSKSVLEAGLTIGSIPMGALLGVFLLGVLTRRPREGAAIAGVAAGLSIVVGIHFYTPIAWTWYVLIGTVTTFGVGLFASLFQGPARFRSNRRRPRTRRRLAASAVPSQPIPRNNPRMENTPRTELKRALGPWAAASIVVGTVIGSGIFLVPQTMIQKVGTVEAVFAVWVVGGLLSLAGALSYAELAAMLPEAGGEYAFLREAYGPLWGFLYSWTQMWVAKSGSIATLATGFFLYLTTFFEPLKGVIYTVPLPIGPDGGPLEIQYGQLFAIALILSLGWLNYYGVKVGGNVQVAVTFLKVALIAAIILAGLVLGHRTRRKPLRWRRSPSRALSRRWWRRFGPTTAGTTSVWFPRKSRIRKRTCRAH